MARKNKNQGEGDYEAARRYRKKSEGFVESGEVEDAAEDAERAVEGKEAGELKRAEERGKARARGFDPEVKKRGGA